MPQARNKPQILCVDRDSLSQRLRREILQAAGYATASVSSLEEIETYLKRNNVALAVVDEAALHPEQLRRTTSKYPSLPIVVLMSTPAVPAPSAQVQYLSKLDGPEAFLQTVKESVKSG